jgi:hypothetical protein
MHEQNFPVTYMYNEQHHDICTVFCSVQFSLFNSIKSIISPRDLLDIELVIVQYIYIHTHTHIHIQVLMHKDSIHKVTIIIGAGNKMTLICGYLIDLIDMIGRSISTIAFDMDLFIEIYTIILYCILYMIREQNIVSYGDYS